MDWQEIFVGHLTGRFALEVLLRTCTMFAAVLVLLRLSGKKGVRQLSIFEIAIVIALGSAAGDPMFNEDEPVGPALVVAATILVLYRAVTWLASKSGRIESLVEGKPEYVVLDGAFVLPGGEAGFGREQFFSEMRRQGVEHVGQVRAAVLETDGELSCFFYPDEQVKPGLPILPAPYRQRSRQVPSRGLYACTRCAQVSPLDAGTAQCSRCEGEQWVLAQTGPRVR
jgi:uncharacterized membrane protein YcaP (DUF421 family)